MNNYRLLTAAGTLAFVAVGISSPLMTLFLEGLGASYIQISLVLASFVCTLLAFSYLWGRLSDRLHRRKPFVVGGLVGLALAYAALGTVPSLATAWITRLLEGAALAAYSTLSLAMLGDAMEHDSTAVQQRGRRMGLYRGLGSLAFAGGSLIGGRLADVYSLSTALAGCAVAYALAASVAVLTRETTSRPTPAEAAPAPGQPSALLPVAFLGGVLLWNAAHYASSSMWPNYMSYLGYTKTALSSLWGLAALVEMPSMFALGALSDRIGRTLLLLTGAVAIALVNAGYAVLSVFILALLAIQILRGIGYAAYTGSAMTFASEGRGDHRGGASGLFNAAGSGGQLLGLLLGGTLVQLAGFQAMFVLCSSLALLSAGVFWLLHQRTPLLSSLLSGPLAERKL